MRRRWACTSSIHHLDLRYNLHRRATEVAGHRRCPARKKAASHLSRRAPLILVVWRTSWAEEEQELWASKMTMSRNKIDRVTELARWGLGGGECAKLSLLRRRGYGGIPRGAGRGSCPGCRSPHMRLIWRWRGVLEGEWAEVSGRSAGNFLAKMAAQRIVWRSKMADRVRSRQVPPSATQPARGLRPFALQHAPPAPDQAHVWRPPALA